MTPSSSHASTLDKAAIYDEVFQRIQALIDDETDWISAMATVSCELHHAFEYYHWTGFYRAISDNMLVVGPYQGTHGCLTISFDRGVCGAAALTRKTQLVADVNAFPGHIACSSTTLSEIVLPVITKKDRLLAVLDVDSNDPAAFDHTDQVQLEQLCRWLGDRFTETSIV